MNLLFLNLKNLSFLTHFLLIISIAVFLFFVPFNYAQAATTGSIMTWGANNRGQLGNGTIIDSLNPVEVSDLNGVKDIASIADYSLALKQDGTVWAWGRNCCYQIGDGTFSHSDPRSIPVQVKDPSDSSGFITNVKAVSAGEIHSISLKTDGTVWAWGTNSYGFLGNGLNGGVEPFPIQVKGSNGQGFLAGIISIAAGYEHSLALKSDGTVWAWGANWDGRLGNNTNNHSNVPAQVKGENGEGYLTDIKKITTGPYHSLALKNDGTVWQWGWNAGQLGDYPFTSNKVPIKINNLDGVVAIAAGADHGMALRSDGSVWVWGKNDYGQLGDGANEHRSQPVRVKDTDGIGFLTDVKAIAAGFYQSYALLKNGTVVAWGNNSQGQLGDGTTDDQSIPIQISELKGITAISAGQNHGLALIGNTSSTLDVPLLKQGIFPYSDNNPSWEGQEFDHAGAGQFTCGTTMAQCGCSTTSIAMVLNYYNITKLPDGTQLNPGTLNTWLKNNNGYDRNVGVRWGVAATIAKKAKTQNPQFAYNSLELDPNRTYDTTKLTNDLINNKMPNILQVNAPGMHFVVATGKENNTFSINDPLFNKTSLSQYNNNAVSVRRYVPANSDMSYITYEVDEDVDIEVKDENGNIVGESYLEYSPAQLTEEPNIIESSAIKVYYFAKPDTGAYTVKLSSPNATSYQLDEVLITQEGDIKTESYKGFLDLSLSAAFNVSFDKQSTENSQTEQVVTFKTLKTDLKGLYVQGQIKSTIVYNTLKMQAEAAEKASLLPIQPLGKKLAVMTLKTFQLELNRQRGKSITEEAYQILYSDADALIKTLQGA